MSIYTGDPKELAQLALDHKLYVHENWMLRPKLEREVEFGKGRVVLTYKEGAPVGVLLASVGGQLMFYVKPEYRGKGLAREMYIEMAEQIGEQDLVHWTGVAYNPVSFRFFNHLNIITVNYEPFHIKLWYLLCERSELEGENVEFSDEHTFYRVDATDTGTANRRRHLLIKYGKPFTEYVARTQVIFYTGPLVEVSDIEMQLVTLLRRWAVARHNEQLTITVMDGNKIPDCLNTVAESSDRQTA